jgi:hypothetical protein
MTLTKEIEQVIAENDIMIGVAKVDHVDTDYEYYLNLPEDELRAMSKEDCIAAQYVLTRYSISIHKRINLLKSFYDANSMLFNRALIKVYHSYNEFLGKDLITASAAAEHSNIEKMQTEMVKLKAVIDSMDGVVDKVDYMVKILSNLAYTKGR